MKKSISVIVPTYKPGNYLFDCLQSLLDQNFKDFEVIIVLNGPRYPYETNISAFISEKNLSNFKLLYSDEKGVSYARNLGIVSANAQSKYICFLDDDDLINSNFLMSLYSVIDEKSLAASRVVSFENSTTNTQKDYLSRYFKNSDNFSLSPNRCPSIFSSACGKLLPRKIISTHKFYTDLSIGEDALFMFELFSEKISNVNFIYDAIYYRRQREGSATHKSYSFGFILKNRCSLISRYCKYYYKNRNKIPLKLLIIKILAIIKSSKNLLR